MECLKLIFHGAAREVGRSCIELQTEGDRYLLDCGVKFCTAGYKYPEAVFKVRELDGILISHAHLDHTGGLPFIEHYGLVCPVFLTPQTLAITKILLKDSYKIAHVKHLHPAWGKVELKEVQKDAHRVAYNHWYQHRKLKFLFLNAGHIPGSAMILVEAEGTRLLYTGDYNTRTTKLMEPAKMKEIVKEHGPIDILITESTYGHRTLPPRPAVETAFKKKILEVINRGGTALVPVFAVGRSQEILILLHELIAEGKLTVPIYFDGMAKEVTRKIIVTESSYVINKDVLYQMLFSRVKLVASQEHRDELVQNGKPKVIVTTSGMMQGGPAIAYLKHLWHDPKNGVLLTGYQVHGTNGRHLIDEGYVHIEGWKTPVKCEVEKYDFSGHADIKDIQKAIWQAEPSTLIIQHGDDESVTNMVAWAKEQTPFTVYGPRLGETIEIKKEKTEMKQQR